MIEPYFKTDLGELYHGDCLETIRGIPDESIDCVITSPPYWQLRDYGFDGQWGTEPSYIDYLNNLWRLMAEIKRVLTDAGTVWINLGDTYGGSGGCHKKHNETDVGFQSKLDPQRGGRGNRTSQKCQLLIPHRFAIGCIDRGWIVRNDIIWAKKNAMPESVTDRFSKRHEYVFFMVKSEKYYFDLDSIRDNYFFDRKNGWHKGSPKHKDSSHTQHEKGGPRWPAAGKNPGDVADFWALSTAGNTNPHYAIFSPDLIIKPIMAGCPAGGVVLDPFCGSGTTLITAHKLGRRYIGIDGKIEYCEIAKDQLLTLSQQRKLF